MRETLRGLGVCMTVAGMVLTFGAAGASDLNTDLSQVFPLLAIGLALLGLGTLLVRVTEIYRRNEHGKKHYYH